MQKYFLTKDKKKSIPVDPKEIDDIVFSAEQLLSAESHRLSKLSEEDEERLRLIASSKLSFYQAALDLLESTYPEGMPRQWHDCHLVLKEYVDSSKHKPSQKNVNRIKSK